MYHLGEGEPARLHPRKLTIFCFVINKCLPVRKGQGKEEEPEESLQTNTKSREGNPGGCPGAGRGSAGCREWSVVLASAAERTNQKMLHAGLWASSPAWLGWSTRPKASFQ